MTSLHFRNNRSGFSLIEVVLALGVFFISILALIGLLSPMLRSVDEIEKIDEISSVVNTVNAFLQGSPEIASDSTTFDAVYSAVEDDDFATIFVFRRYISDTSTQIQLKVGFEPSDSGGSLVNTRAIIDDFSNAAGPIYRVVLTPSSVIPVEVQDPNDPNATVVYRSEARDGGTKTYTLEASLSQYLEGYFAMEARIFAEDPRPGYDPAVLPNTKSATLVNLGDIEPDFTFNTAIVR